MTSKIVQKTEKSYKSDYITRTDIAEYKENPWSNKLVTNMKVGKKITGFASRDATIIDNKTGEVTDTTFLGTSKTVDKEEFIKFFGAGVVATFDLSKTARDVFQIMLHLYLETNTITTSRMDQMYLNYTKMKDTGYLRTNKTFVNGLNELMKTEFLAPIEGMRHWYWLNPTFFIKGDRIVLVKEFKLRKSKQEQLEDSGQMRLLEG